MEGKVVQPKNHDTDHPYSPQHSVAQFCNKTDSENSTRIDVPVIPGTKSITQARFTVDGYDSSCKKRQNEESRVDSLCNSPEQKHQKSSNHENERISKETSTYEMKNMFPLSRNPNSSSEKISFPYDTDSYQSPLQHAQTEWTRCMTQAYFASSANQLVKRALELNGINKEHAAPKDKAKAAKKGGSRGRRKKKKVMRQSARRAGQSSKSPAIKPEPVQSVEVEACHSPSFEVPTSDVTPSGIKEEVPSTSAVTILDAGTLKDMCTAIAATAPPESVAKVKRKIIRKKETKRIRKASQCDECGKVFTRKDHLHVHKRNHTGERPYRCEICNWAFADKSNLQRHKRTHAKEKPFKCDLCDKSFSLIQHLQGHVRTHTGEKPFKCDICDKAYADKSNLQKHKATHTDRPFKCEVCFKTFPLDIDLQSHKVQRNHFGDRPYKCKICEKAFTDKSNLTRHQKTHSQDRPFHCDLCGKSFALIHHYQGHVRTHTGERPFKCDMCDKAYADKSNLQKHRTAHIVKPYKCEDCGKCFTLDSELQAHRRVHTGEREFICFECGETFDRNDSFQRHKRIHSGERPFKCDFCGKTFNDNSHCIRHKKLHAKDFDLNKSDLLDEAEGSQRNGVLENQETSVTVIDNPLEDMSDVSRSDQGKLTEINKDSSNMEITCETESKSHSSISDVKTEPQELGSSCMLTSLDVSQDKKNGFTSGSDAMDNNYNYLSETKCTPDKLQVQDENSEPGLSESSGSDTEVDELFD